MALIDEIYENYKSISIVGMAKNAGKTVTLNYIIDEADYKNICLGITSTGRDGEHQDIVTTTEKPKIYVYEGTYIATSEDTLSMGDAKIEIIRVTNHRTPMGKIVLGKVRESGFIQIAGPQTAKGIREISDMLLDLGAELIIIDGAINRISSASPSVSQGCILSTGAVVSRDMNKAIKETLHTTELFSLPEVKENTLRALASKSIAEGKVTLIDDCLNVNCLDIKTAINAGKTIGQSIEDKTCYIVIPKALVKNTVEDIIKATRRIKDITFIVQDGTKIFIKSEDWIRFRRYGLNVKVVKPISILAVTINPYSPQGYYFDQREFLKKMKNFLKEIPVYDVMSGGDLYE